MTARNRRSRRERQRLHRKLAITAAAFAAVCVVLVAVMSRLDHQSALSEEDAARLAEAEQVTEETVEPVEIGGQLYTPKENIETYLFMGIDDAGKVEKKTEYDGTGQCDVLLVIVRDMDEGTYRTLTLDRNTMTDVKSLTPDGTYLATTRNQLALSHSDGDGMEISCENTVDAVSNLLYGQQIDGYAALNMGAIRVLNHLVGGVTVTIEDDFSQADPSMVMGETITLTDEQAVTYIQGRMNVGDGTNESRIRRQSQYLELLAPILQQKCSEDNSFPLTIYDALGDYLVTNISTQKFTRIALLMAGDNDAGEIYIEGTSHIGDMDFIEFEPDEDSLAEAVTTLFYEKYEG